MAQHAAQLHFGNPVFLARELVGECLGRGRLIHRQPVVGRVDLRGSLLGRGISDLKRELLAARRRARCRISEPVSADPHLIGAVGKIGHDEAPLVIGDHDPAEMCGETARLCNDPHTRLGPLTIGVDDHTSDADLVNLNSLGRALFRAPVGHSDSERQRNR